jgi:hypothetical protein
MPENSAQLHGLQGPLSNVTTARVSGYEPSGTGKPQLDLSLSKTPNTSSKYSRADGSTPEDSDTWVWTISICGLIKILDPTLSALQSSSSEAVQRLQLFQNGVNMHTRATIRRTLLRIRFGAPHQLGLPPCPGHIFLNPVGSHAKLDAPPVRNTSPAPARHRMAKAPKLGLKETF